MRTKNSNRIKAEKTNGNIFADLGLPHPQREIMKVKLTLETYRLIRKRNLTQAEARKILGITPPHVSALMRNPAGSFSVERLMDFLTALGQDVEISVQSARETTGRSIRHCMRKPSARR
jgi:predicted XRE-type DNA-binding protein